ncbi:unnamed protein product [Candida verbasci]|uniref:N-acetyltransferase domain-containing protein n=1 Tax=Candida verbasci TaxID=1227364 RepID=A0A9W4XMZ5_9ASCO|nr:unnamed protein product [Candida verbasci]
MSLDANFEFKSTINDSNIISQVYLLCGSQWSGPLGADNFSKICTSNHLNYLEQGGISETFCIIEKSSNKVIASTIIKHQKSLFKPADKSHAISSVPDPSSFGIKHITSLLVSFVFVDEKYRSKGLARQVVSKAIESTESNIIKKHLDLGDDNFKKMCIDETTGHVDPQLANYYLSKEYVWYLYSGVNTYYERFGFKSYPLDFYKIPTGLLSEGQEDIIKQLVENPDSHHGKHLKLLLSDNEEDLNIIKFILQTKELEILTELNKLLFHSDLQSDRRSSTSLTNMSTILSMSRLGSNHALSSITESNQPNIQGNARKSSAQNQTISKFSIKPDFLHYQWNSIMENGMAGSETAKKFSNIKGAILTNDLQQKSHYILWNCLKGEFFIIGMGEIQYQGNQSGNYRRRGSSFTGLNELGGYNFQDLDLLISAALYNAKNRGKVFNNVYISLNDLPDEIPDNIMQDFFINYLPFSSYASEEHKEAKKQENEKQEKEYRCELITDAAKQVGVLPMLKKFGSKSFEYELDWISNGMWCWG